MTKFTKRLAQIFPTTIVGYHCPDYERINRDLCDQLAKEPWQQGRPQQTQDRHLEQRPQYHEIHQWFQECLEDHRRSYQYQCQSLEITLSWANRSHQGDQHRRHQHFNSWLSAVYYASPHTSPTVFEDPRNHLRSGLFVDSLQASEQPEWPCPPEPGLLILFPSFVPHRTLPWAGQEPRITLSFNVMPRGVINQDSLTELTLNPGPHSD